MNKKIKFFKKFFFVFLLGVNGRIVHGPNDKFIQFFYKSENENILKKLIEKLKNKLNIENFNITDFLIEKKPENERNNEEIKEEDNDEDFFNHQREKSRDQTYEYPKIIGNFSLLDMLNYYDVDHDVKNQLISNIGFKNLTNFSQKIPKIVLQEYRSNGSSILNVLILDQDYVDINFEKNIEFYKKLTKEKRIEISSENNLFYYGNDVNANNNEFSFQGKKLLNVLQLRSSHEDESLGKIIVELWRKKTFKAIKLPFVEIISAFLLSKIQNQINQYEGQIVFSGCGFSGAIAQEMAYQFLKTNNNKKDKIQVLTSQAMRYLSEYFALDYLNVLGEENIFSLRSEYNPESEGEGIVVHLKPIENEDDKYIFKSDENNYNTINGYFFQKQIKKENFHLKEENKIIEENIKHILNFHNIEKKENDISYFQIKELPKEEKNNFIKFILSSAPQGTQSSAKALVALPVGNDLFIKLSQKSVENDNLENLRRKLNIFNEPAKIELEDINLSQKNIKCYFNIPSSFVGSNENKQYTATIAYNAGNYSALNFIKEDLKKQNISEHLKNASYLCGAAIAKMHNRIGLYGTHGDVHAENIRFLVKENNITEVHIIDVETALSNKKSENIFYDILMFIAKTIAHKFKSKTYGTNKFGDASKTFTMETLRGYIENLNKETFDQLVGELHNIKNTEGKNLFYKGFQIQKLNFNELLKTEILKIINVYKENNIKDAINFEEIKKIFQQTKKKFKNKKPEEDFAIQELHLKKDEKLEEDDLMIEPSLKKIKSADGPQKHKELEEGDLTEESSLKKIKSEKAPKKNKDLEEDPQRGRASS